ncbi:MAG: hypothetical protein RLZZ09_563 [Pseudomonadota bacterium]
MNIKKTFLIVAFAMVTVIALLYGVSPQWFGRTFLGLSELDANIAHILRAVMGLYLALGGFWLYAAFHEPLRNVAILVAGLFAGGLVSGRFISLMAEGVPSSSLLIFYILAELALVPVAYWVYTREDE